MHRQELASLRNRNSVLRAALSFSILLAVVSVPGTETTAAPVAEPAAAAALSGLSIGYEIGAASEGVDPLSAMPYTDPAANGDSLVPVRLRAVWPEIERERGIYDWSALSAAIDRNRALGREPILCLAGGNTLYGVEGSGPATPPVDFSNDAGIKGWEAFARSAAQQFLGRVRFYEVWERENDPASWPGKDAVREYAFLFKKTSTILRAEGGKGVRILIGGIAGADTAFLRKLFDDGISPYQDIVAIRPKAGESTWGQVQKITSLLQELSPASGLWAMGLDGTEAGVGPPTISGVARQTLEAFGAGAKLVTFGMPFVKNGWPVRADALVRLHALFTPGLDRLPDSRARFAVPAVTSLTFFNPGNGVALIGYYAPDRPVAEPPLDSSVTIDARRPGPPLLYDPVAGGQTQPEFTAVAGGASGKVAVSGSPLFLLYKEGVGQLSPEAAAQIEQGPENVNVTAERGITAEEIISQHQQVAARQQARLLNYQAKGMVQFHFRLGTASETVDVAMGGNFFFDPETGPEWEFTDYFINGNRSKWKKFPELPLIQPEKVVTLPLDISFDKSYTYSLSGEDKVEGREAWVLAFDPVDPEKTLYRGKVWIDKKTFNKVRTSVVQTKLETPFISSEERDIYAPVTITPDERVPGGAAEPIDLWVLSRIDGQQIYTTIGKNFVVTREVTFDSFNVNGANFRMERDQAYTSDNQMLRETGNGFKYLDKDEAGVRRVKESADNSQLFGLAGLLFDNSRSYPLPLLGVNYFDYNLRGTGIQTNVFFAGVLVNANATLPNVHGSGFDIGATLFGLGISGTDSDFQNGREIQTREVKTKNQSIAIDLGHALGSFGKLRTRATLERVEFGGTDNTATTFVVPQDVWQRNVELFGSYDWSGWSVNGAVSLITRSKWPFWGCTEPATNALGKPRHDFCGSPVFQADWNPDAVKYDIYQAVGSKEFYLPYFQKVKGEIGYYGGRDLDRFSRYTFGLFGTRLRGFGGSGVRYDEGVIARASYLFNVGQVVRFNATLDQARVRDRSQPGGFQNFTGFGVSANFLGPKETVIQFDAGYALASDVRKAKGGGELLFVILKLF